MRDAFPGHYPPNDEERSAMWSEGLIVLNTNALLNLFKYSKNTRAEFFAALDSKKDQLWLPFQVGVEFHRNRRGEIRALEDHFTTLKDTVGTAEKQILGEINRFRNHPAVDRAKLQDTVKGSLKRFTNEVVRLEGEYKKSVIEPKVHEKTTETIAALYQGKIGPEPTQSELDAFYKEGEARYEAKIPPGYKDIQKPEPRRYGDLIIWKQILDKARDVAKHVIFVTDDTKEDWWLIEGAKKVSARPELVHEFDREVGKRVHFYTPDRFVQEIRSGVGGSAAADAVNEIASISEYEAQKQAAAREGRRRKGLRDQRLEVLTREQTLRTKVRMLDAELQDLASSENLTRREADRLFEITKVRASLQSELDELRRDVEKLRKLNSASSSLRARQERHWLPFSVESSLPEEATLDLPNDWQDS
ncbi:PIN-like domain-containing protein [Leucobacter chromiiresistens]|uniref:PIN like domain-containing protein n=1 Tax=Leucobacter chromiiresistens TaxID=1079994 RepID=A0A1H1A141_9MICO|nr:PIN domain-containing protein [Leucobacter chromiiresistens]SDQ32996.1 hypothetical protein SAMN04488565_2217 [Leucobacter chromiiresistens]